MFATMFGRKLLNALIIGNLTCLMTAYAQNPGYGATHTVKVTMLSNARPADLPVQLSGVVGRLPRGSFIVENHSAVPIKVVIPIWTFFSAGEKKQVRLNFDDYWASPSPNAVDPYSTAVFTPRAYITEKNYAKASTSPEHFFGDDSPQRIPTDASDIVLNVDCVIFSDGAILGPDTMRYSEVIRERRSALDELLQELGDSDTDDALRAKSRVLSGQPVSDDFTRHKHSYASLIARSPSPSALIRQLKLSEIPARFVHLDRSHLK